MAEEYDDKQPPIYAEDEPEGGLFRWMSALVVLLAVAGFFGLAWYAYKNGGETLDEKDVELVKADKTPVKEAPANPGGMQIPNQDKTVYGLISGKNEQPVVERILPAPEEPIQRNGDTETWMSDSVKNKISGEVETVKISPSASAPAVSDTNNTAPMNSTAPKEQFNPAKIRVATTPKTPGSPPPVPPVQITAVKPPAPAVLIAPSAPPAPVAPPVVPVITVKPPAAPVPVPVKTPPEQEKKPETKPEAKPEKKPEPATSTDTPPPGARIQLGAYKSQSEADSNWARISRKFSNELKDRRHYVVRVDLGKKGVFYRLQVAPFASGKDAEQFCVDFVSDGQGCILARGK